ncbi:3-methyl-2-oxobutanoate hydroxymethyltransferase [Roseisolibacter sp. H3M3-2]|uniref:3-methyl-2-oxobutanoate hydroxymethyltransferase n=1 Tax=Roseisolibacter sp. H3M3-2 TaxID=3031323 RepID=UPI0023DBE49D|nr:3-methyl-2-oxobutanoate hydroxymethyltransferase [Roseisolibacter sp. H3M3-2]MDF1501537.1 3-methyl-2-oxobutanoate hydroxymethyltransferase [Roseisolibacter sp. H3M3-2]
MSQASGSAAAPKKVTVRSFAQAKARKESLVMVAAYDALFARLSDEAGVDAVLVGDSLGNVVAGLETTVPVTLEQMIYHGAAARRGTARALLVVDMPFLTYQVTTERALLNCGRVMQETRCDAVKVEGGSPEMAETVRALVRAGIPVMGHLGFTPQSVHVLGGFRVQGREEEAAQRMVDDARRLEDAGAFSVVLELVPAAVAQRVTEAVGIPTIGIGAGAACDGQVLVLADLLGLTDGFAPKFLKRYATLAADTRDAVRRYADEVRGRAYPGDEHAF